jgi:sRNA-binding regulator protein Hfq
MSSAGKIFPAGSGAESSQSRPRSKKKWNVLLPASLTAHQLSDEQQHGQAELFYLQKQIQMQTPMVVLLDDGEKIEGRIEWYDRWALKIGGRTRTLIYKCAIKYMYKLNEQGTRGQGLGIRD